MTWQWWLANINDPWLPMSPLEVVATIFGLWSVWCDVIENLWTWPTGLANVLLYIVLFWNCQLYCETGLQLVFVVLQIYGWWQWVYGGKDHTGVKIERTPPRTWLILGVIALVAIVPLGMILKRWASSTTPWWDTIPTVLSLVAQWMLNKKLLENWWIWILVDLISIPLFAYKGLYLTAGLYFVFLLLCVKGYATWKRPMSPAIAVA